VKADEILADAAADVPTRAGIAESAGRFEMVGEFQAAGESHIVLRFQPIERGCAGLVFDKEDQCVTVWIEKGRCSAS